MVITGHLFYKTFEGYHKAIACIEKDILILAGLIVNNIRTEHAIDDKTQVPAYIPVFIIELAFFVFAQLPAGFGKRELVGRKTGKLRKCVREFFGFGHTVKAFFPPQIHRLSLSICESVANI
jgi:hypothetical protein